MRTTGMVLIALAVILQIAVVAGFTDIFTGARDRDTTASPAELSQGIHRWLKLSWVGGSTGAVGLFLLIVSSVRRRRAARAAATGK